MISLKGTGSIDVEMREMYRRYGRIVRTCGNVERLDHEGVARSRLLPSIWYGTGHIPYWGLQLKLCMGTR
jgi:hypothetical protein